jgi:hypothetical protein
MSFSFSCRWPTTAWCCAFCSTANATSKIRPRRRSCTTRTRLLVQTPSPPRIAKWSRRHTTTSASVVVLVTCSILLHSLFSRAKLTFSSESFHRFCFLCCSICDVAIVFGLLKQSFSFLPVKVTFPFPSFPRLRLLVMTIQFIIFSHGLTVLTDNRHHPLLILY